MTDGEQEPGYDVEIDDVKAAKKRYNEASPENREATWLELWHARDFTWHGRSEKAMLQTDMVEVPSSFPDSREAEGEFKSVSLKDHWRWSVGLPGEERLLTDEEMREAGLLVEVDGETYHLIHAPDMGLKVDEHGAPLRVLKDIVAAREKRVPEDIGTDGNGQPNFARSLQLQGSWLPGEVLRHAGTETAVMLSGARVSDVNLRGLKFGPLNCVQSLFVGGADFRSATFSGMAIFWRATFSGAVDFERATFGGKAIFEHMSLRSPWTFKNGSFEDVADFSHARWPIDHIPNGFKGARFRDRVFFGSAAEIGISAFNEPIFEVLPSFDDLTRSQVDWMFRDAINRTNASIKRAKRESAKARRRGEWYTGPTSRELWDALEGGFRTFKTVAEGKGNKLLSQTFYLFEIRAHLRRPDIRRLELDVAIGTFYDLSSSYGNSINRPPVWFAFTIAGFAAIYLALAIQVDLVDWHDRGALQTGFLESLDFSLKNVFRPLSALSTDAPRDGDATSWAGKLLNNYGKGFGLIVTSISIVQSLTGIVLAFLFGLAVRRRFQIS